MPRMPKPSPTISSTFPASTSPRRGAAGRHEPTDRCVSCLVGGLMPSLYLHLNLRKGTFWRFPADVCVATACTVLTIRIVSTVGAGTGVSLSRPGRRPTTPDIFFPLDRCNWREILSRVGLACVGGVLNSRLVACSRVSFRRWSNPRWR